MGIIISAFPGCGKTFLTENAPTGIKISDSDSSAFDKSDFPNNYIEHIKEITDDYDIVFVSSHKEVRDALEREEINYDLFYPDIKRKTEFLINYARRRSPSSLIQKIDHNFNKWIREIDNKESTFCHKHKLMEPNHFIGNDPMIIAYINDRIAKNKAE